MIGSRRKPTISMGTACELKSMYYKWEHVSFGTVSLHSPEKGTNLTLLKEFMTRFSARTLISGYIKLARFLVNRYGNITQIKK